MNGVSVVTNLTTILGIIAFVMGFQRAFNFLFLLVHIRLAVSHINNVCVHTYIPRLRVLSFFFLNRLPMPLLFLYPVPTIVAGTHTHVRANTQQNFHTWIHAIIHA